MARKSSIASGKPTKPTAKRSRPSSKQAVYQFKISLRDCKPLIWRRIQVQDCTLDKLHESIQTAMGWTNSHLHHFRVGKQLYGDPEVMQENFEDLGYKDSTKTMISNILPVDGKRFSFSYEYDFGDSWEHEIRFEGACEPTAASKCPVCIEGERACPPEDCGGVWGYADLLEAINDKKHERHDELLEWLGESFDPDAFDSHEATERMKTGMPYLF